MRLKAKATSLFVGILISQACANQNCRLKGLSVSPTTAISNHLALTPGNQVRFWASAIVPKGCLTAACINCSQQTWTASDPVNVSISNGVSDNGTATCLGATSGPVTITATAPAGAGSSTKVTGTATLTCQ